jgi:GT2 family glycosyltransferase
MATRILDVELSDAAVDRTGLAGYDHAMLILRSGQRVLGLVTVRVTDGKVPAVRIRNALRPDLFVFAEASRAEAALEVPAPPAPASIVAAICTRERPEDLSRALSALVAMPFRGDGIIVVDNCPATDATRRVVEGFPGVRYVVEPHRGLDNARNRALAEATSDIVAFIDDDAVADAGWLDAIRRPFADPDVMVVTGLTLPFELENAAQELFETHAGFSKRGFVRRVFETPRTHPLDTGRIGAGANMAIRSAVAGAVGLFDPALDAGTPTQSGGDHEFFSRVLRGGYRIVYDPSALNFHRHRRTDGEMLKAIHGYGVGVYAHFTRCLLTEGDRSTISRAARWFAFEQFPNLLRALLRPGPDHRMDVCLAELRGCVKGPLAYVRSRRAARAAKMPGAT